MARILVMCSQHKGWTNALKHSNAASRAVSEHAEALKKIQLSVVHSIPPQLSS